MICSGLYPFLAIYPPFYEIISGIAQGGHVNSWFYTGKVKDDIIDITVDTADANMVCYATTSKVYLSDDAGQSYRAVAKEPGGAGSNGIEITSIDVATTDTGQVIVIGMRDTDNNEYGGVYIRNVNQSTAFIDTHIGNYDVYAVSFSPDYFHDRQVEAVVTDEAETLVTTMIGNGGWGENIDNISLGNVVPESAVIAFPDDYTAEVAPWQYSQFVAVSTGTGGGDVYRIKCDDSHLTVKDLNIGSEYGLDNTDVAGLAISGNGENTVLMAGTAASAQVHVSNDEGESWSRSTKNPTGGFITGVLFASGYPADDRLYVSTSGSESALSVSEDGGITWNQICLIDTAVSAIVDFAVSPDYERDNTFYLLTFGDGKHSLWRSLDSGMRWKRVYSSAYAHIDEINYIGISPQYSSSGVLLLAGKSNAKSMIWKSADRGGKFIGTSVTDPESGDTLDIDAWAIAGDNTVFVGSYDGSKGVVYRTDNAGLFYSAAAEAGNTSLNSVAMSPDYENDKTILAGNTDGGVYWSNDNGASFESLPPDNDKPLTDGFVRVVFDRDYRHNHTVYATSSSPNRGVYRFIIGHSSEWESIDNTLPDGGMFSSLVSSVDGVLYATNSQQVYNADAKGGMERCLNPTFTLGPKFETVIKGLADGVKLTRLWIRGSRLWAYDVANIRLMTYTDSLSQPVIPDSFADDMQAMGTKNVILK